MWTTCREYVIMLRSFIDFMYLFIHCLQHGCSIYEENKYSGIFLSYNYGIMFNI